MAALWSACTAAAILSQPSLAGGAGELHAAQAAGVAESALAVEAARLAAAISASTSAEAKLQAEAAKELAAEALVAVADLRALASATTVWRAFDGLPPDEGAGEVLKANRGAWMSAVTLVKESFVAAKVSLLQDSDPARWHRGPPLVLQVVPAIKDLGVAQGAGRVGKELQAARARVAFDRWALVGKLGVPRAKLGLLAGASGLTAGMYGAAAHVYDADFLPAMRRWVMYATYRGSRFAQVRLYMHLALPCKSADPFRVALRKGWECCSLVRRQWGDAVFAEVWESSSADGPLLSFRRLLQEVGLEASFVAGGPTWRRKHSAYRRLDQGLEASDLAWVAERRKGLQDAVNIDVQATRALAGRLPAGGLREAYQSAIIGDMVVRATTRHWQGPAAACVAWRPRLCSTFGGDAPATSLKGWAAVGAA